VLDAVGCTTLFILPICSYQNDLTFYLTSLPQNKLLRSFAFTSSRIVLREHFCTLKYIPIQQGTRVCLHGSQARVKSTDLGPNHHLHNNKIKKNSYTLLCGILLTKYQSIHLTKYLKAYALAKAHNTSTIPGIIFCQPCFDVNLSGNRVMQP
jgi:hypothetical protein